MELFPYIMTGLIGLAIGSFLNVVIFRLPRRDSPLKGRSQCPHCHNKLRWYHNVPVVSYLALRGKCAFCKAGISFRYPAVELVNALAYLYFYHQFGLSSEFFIYAFISSAMLAIFFIDLDFRIIPDVITLPGMVLGLTVSIIPGGLSPLESLTGLIIGGGALYAVAVLGDWLFKKESMGGGDIKMTAMLGAFLGWQKVLLVFMASAFIGLIVSLALMTVSARLRSHRVIPFGPFLSAAAMLAVVYGDQLIELYVLHFLHSR